MAPAHLNLGRQLATRTVIVLPPPVQHPGAEHPEPKPASRKRRQRMQFRSHKLLSRVFVVVFICAVRFFALPRTSQPSQLLQCEVGVSPTRKPLKSAPADEIRTCGVNYRAKTRCVLHLLVHINGIVRFSHQQFVKPDQSVGSAASRAVPLQGRQLTSRVRRCSSDTGCSALTPSG